MLTCGQNARRMGRDDANLAGSGCSECMACGDRALTRRAFASLAGLAAGSVLLGVLPGCTGSDAGQTVPAANEGEGSNSGEGGKDEMPPTSESAPAAPSAALSPGLLCVAEYANNTLAVVDPATGEILQRIAAGQNPATALVADGWVYVGSSGGGEVTAVSIADPSQVTSITVGKQPLGLCYDGAQGILYVGDYFASSIHLVDTQLKSLVKTVKLSASGYHNRTDPPDCCRIDPGTGRRTVALALAPEGNLLYCANYGTFDVARVDLATGEEIEAFDGVVGPRQILVSADGAQLLLAGVGATCTCSTVPRANACRRCRWASLSPAWLRPLTARRCGPLPATMGSWWPSTPTGTRRGVCLWAWASIRSYLLPTRRRCWLATASAAKCTWWMRRRWRC